MLTSLENFNHSFQTALKGKRVVPYFQPIVALRDESVTGLEVLARWIGPEVGTISPAIFIPLAAQGNLLDALMESMMRQAFEASRAWPGNLRLAFNVSPEQLHNPDLPNRIERIAQEGAFPLSRIRIEITETASMETGASEVMSRLSALGCNLAMDDFGTGYASLSWLRTMPFDVVKIDASFVRNMMAHRPSRKIVTAVVSLCQSLDLKVVAEGVETAEEVEFLRRIGCSHVQGYFFARPMSAESVTKYIAEKGDLIGRKAVTGSTFEQRAAQIAAIYNEEQTSIVFADLNYKIVDASKSFANRFFRKVEDVIGCSIYELAPDTLKQAPKLRSYRERGLPYPPFEFHCPDGKIDLVTLTQVKDETGALIGFLMFGMDIANLPKAEMTLRANPEES